MALKLVSSQEAQPERVQELAAALQHGTPHGWPVLVAVAGLVSVRQAKRLTTYFEHGRWHELGVLDRAATRRALQEPAAAAGCPFDEQAAQLIAHASGGYPYAIQVYGDCAWLASEGQDQIDLKATERGLRTGGPELDQSLYAQRWASAHHRANASTSPLWLKRSTSAARPPEPTSHIDSGVPRPRCPTRAIDC